MDEFEDDKYCDYDDYKTEVCDYRVEADDGYDLIESISGGNLLSIDEY
jgi:hypothetical protein